MDIPTAIAPAPGAVFQPHPAWREVLEDVVLVAVALVGVFVLFYHSWPIWEDQGIYHYMAWGLQHGLRPYADTVNMNWPGIVVVHWVARLLSGANPFGLRLLDVAFQLILAGTTSTLLVRYGIAQPLRLWCQVLFLTTYFLTGFEATAQRESFCLPLVSVGLVLVLGAAEGARWDRLPIAFACGLVAGLGLWIKPVLGLPLAVACGIFLLRSPAPLPRRLAFVASMAGGALAATAGALLFLYQCCDLAGFWHWGVSYAFGPYAAARWPVTNRLHQTFVNLAFSPTPVLLFAIGLAAYGYPWRRRPETPPSSVAHIRRGTIAGLLAVLLSIYVTIFMQGKTGCLYHFIPLQWALALTGIVLVATILPADRAHGMRLLLGACAAVTLWATLRLCDARVPPTDGTRLARQLKGELADTDEVVIFGFSTTFLAELERRTPFPFVDGWIQYCGCNGQAKWENMIVQSLRAALARREVKYFIVQRGLGWPQPKFERPAELIVATHLSGEDLAALGFQAAQQVKMPGGTKYDIYRRE